MTQLELKNGIAQVFNRFKIIEEFIPKLANNLLILQNDSKDKDELIENNFRKLVSYVKKHKEELRDKAPQATKVFASELNRYVQTQILLVHPHFDQYFGEEATKTF